MSEVVKALRPTVLVGTTGTPGIFTEPPLRDLAAHVEAPLVMALSNPTSKSEAVPADVLRWTEGRAYVATGSPFGPVEHHGRIQGISQCNNVYVFPGVGLGSIVAEATEVTDSMFTAAAHALADRVDAQTLRSGLLYPPLAELRSISRSVALAVAKEARDSGVGVDVSDGEIGARLDHEMWDLDYPTLRPA